MARQSNKQSQNNNLFNFDFKFSLKAQLSPKGQEFLETSIEAGKTIIKVGKIAIPILALLGMGLKSCIPEQTKSTPSASIAIVVAKKP
jgi:hypothetical protein